MLTRPLRCPHVTPIREQHRLTTIRSPHLAPLPHTPPQPPPSRRASSQPIAPRLISHLTHPIPFHSHLSPPHRYTNIAIHKHDTAQHAPHPTLPRKAAHRHTRPLHIPPSPFPPPPPSHISHPPIATPTTQTTHTTAPHTPHPTTTHSTTSARPVPHWLSQGRAHRAPPNAAHDVRPHVHDNHRHQPVHTHPHTQTITHTRTPAHPAHN